MMRALDSDENPSLSFKAAFDVAAVGKHTSPKPMILG